MTPVVELSKAEASTAELSKAAPFLVEQDYAAYTPDQHDVWAELVLRRMPQLQQHAAQEYLDGLDFLSLPIDRLPNLAGVSAKLQRRTGWNTTPVSGFMPAPAFFQMLAARRFPTTTWLRGRDSFKYTPEPDIFHDVFGHVPMHAHPVFADFLADYGKLCEQIKDEAILERIGRFFWYTVEFGLIQQKGRIKVYGSGLISSDGECSNVVSDACAVRPFALDEVLQTPVKVDQMHRLLFAIEDFDQLYSAMQALKGRLDRGNTLDA